MSFEFATPSLPLSSTNYASAPPASFLIDRFVDQRVDPAEKHTGNRRDWIKQQARLCGPLKAVKVGLLPRH